MKRQLHLLRKGALYTLAVLLIGGYPTTVFAEDTPAEASKSTYSYNEQTGHWDSDKWQYDPVSGKYVPTPSPASPSVATNSATSVPTPPESSDIPATAPSATTPLDSPQSSLDTTSTAAEVSNGLSSQATSGNANVNHNTTAGSATSGDALAQTTIVNTVHSTVQGDTLGVAHFVADIYGNVTGDITLSPAIQAATTGSSSLAEDTTINNATRLTNNVSLGATSGNADVSYNTAAGNATSGNAHTVANIVNLINSIIAANKSFVGTINIHGSLDGDILISPDFIPQLIATNASDPTVGPLSLDLNGKQSIVNNVTLGATAGSAFVAHNTSAGSATSGSAATNLTILNLTGRQVIAKNSLLVFVNVLGTWVGLIIDAPVGTTAAMLGNGVTDNSVAPLAQNITATTDDQIVNNIDLTSHSGDASVTHNTAAGSATTGNATASANIANVSNSSFSIGDWFGVLFINVFGSWLGSFGVNTSHGDTPPVPLVAPLTMTLTESPAAPNVRFGFTPRATTTQFVEPFAPQSSEGSTAADDQFVSSTVAAEENNMAPPSSQPAKSSWLFTLMMTGFVGAAITTLSGKWRPNILRHSR